MLVYNSMAFFVLTLTILLLSMTLRKSMGCDSALAITLFQADLGISHYAELKKLLLLWLLSHVFALHGFPP